MLPPPYHHQTTSQKYHCMHNLYMIHLEDFVHIFSAHFEACPVAFEEVSWCATLSPVYRNLMSYLP